MSDKNKKPQKLKARLPRGFVDREGDAERAQLLEAGDGAVDVVHQHAFGELQGQALGRHRGLGEHAADHGHEAFVAELARRDVHHHAQRRAARLAPGAVALAGGAQHPLADRQDQPGVLGERDEALW